MNRIKVLSPNTNYKREPQDVDSPEGREYLREIRATSTDSDAALDYKFWLPFAAKEYRISPRIEDYVIVNTPMLPSDIPNRNGLAFPLRELVAFRPPPISRIMYKAWIGAPTFEEHTDKPKDGDAALGIILDTSLVPIKNFGGGRHRMVTALLAFDKTKLRNQARIQRIVRNEVNTYSMGAACNYFTCGMTGIRLDPKLHKSRLDRALEFDIVPDPLTYERTLLFRNAHELSANECSTVDDPAWVPAMSNNFFEL